MNIYSKKWIVYWAQMFGIRSLFVSIWFELHRIVHDRLNITVTYLSVIVQCENVLRVIMLSVIMLSVIMLSLIMLSVIMLSVIIQSIVIMKIILLSVVAPFTGANSIKLFLRW